MSLHPAKDGYLLSANLEVIVMQLKPLHSLSGYMVSIEASVEVQAEVDRARGFLRDPLDILCELETRAEKKCDERHPFYDGRDRSRYVSRWIKRHVENL